MASSPELRADQRAVLRLALGTLVVGALVLIWELLANQAPYTPAAIPSLVAPVAQLRSAAFTTGLITLGLVPALPQLAPDGLPRWWIPAGILTTIAMLASLGACAGANVMGLQLYDPQPGARVFVYARLVTQGLAALFLVDLARRAFSRKRAS